MEEGGHPGANPLSTFVNGAYALDKIHIPLVIGGGIGNGRQIAAALALGADGVVMGSRFMVASEIVAHEALKQRIVDADADCSTAILASLGDTWRVLANQAAREVQRLEAAGARQHSDFGDLIRRRGPGSGSMWTAMSRRASCRWGRLAALPMQSFRRGRSSKP